MHQVHSLKETMNKQIYFRQCVLRKKLTNSYLEQTSYIPEPFCAVDKILKLRNEDNTWDDGWIVIIAHPEKRLAKDVPDAHEMIKSHRKATGDAEPKAIKVK
jgi:hypothetical protein